MISPYALYRGRRWMGILSLKILGKISSVRLAPHCWMRGISRRLEQLMTPHGLRGVSSNYETCKTTLPHMRIKESVGLISYKSKPYFFSSDEREKLDFWKAIVGIRAQSHGLGFGLVRGRWKDQGGTNSCWKSQFKVSLARNEYMVVREGTPHRMWWVCLKCLFWQLERPSRKLHWWGRAS